MKRILFLILALLILGWRWLSLDSLLPLTWTPDSTVRFTATILDRPEINDTKTIVRIGRWYIPLTGYAGIMPGDVVAFSGTAHPTVLLGKTTRIVMQDPIFEIITPAKDSHLGVVESGLIALGRIREFWVQMLEKYLPEPMSSLAAGILLGVNREMPADFYDSLVATGTLHIVAASGYNVSIVAEVIMQIVGRFFKRSSAISFGVVGIIVYVILAGLSASVVRAGIMGTLTLIAYYWGRPSEARRLLWVTGFLMLYIDPLQITDIGFQLSFAATAGILYLELPLRQGLQRLTRSMRTVQDFLVEYLSPTLAATLVTSPLILFHFGRLSLISPLVNLLVLPALPLIMLLTTLVIGVGSLISSVGQLIAWFLYVPLWLVVSVITLFG